jgi:hypothetical protein
LFVDTNNKIYVAEQGYQQILVWFDDYINVTTTISNNLINPSSVFVTNTDDVYVNDGDRNGHVNKWTFNASASAPAMDINTACYGLFVDITNTLYCSMRDFHQVVKRWLGDSVLISTPVAGTGEAGSTPDKFNLSYGIFVNINLDLYVADCGNDRVQQFEIGQLNGNTVAGVGAPNTISLNCPTGVVLDADHYLFIVDSGNHRIVGSGPTGFRCVVGCFGGGSAPNQLNNPQSMSFDSFGNIFIIDPDNSRTQKLMLATNSCSKYDNY